MNGFTVGTELAALLEYIDPNAKRYTLEEVFAPAQIAMDSSVALDASISPQVQSLIAASMGGAWGNDIQPFMGYPAIAALRTSKTGIIYDNIITGDAEDMTSEGFELESTRDDVNKDKLKELVDIANEEWDILGLFRDWWKTYFGWDGGGLVFIDIKGHDSDAILQSELRLDSKTIREGELRGFRKVEAMNCQPLEANYENPLHPDYYSPLYWSIMGRKVHRSRFLYFAQNQLPTLLKPAYNFMGLPLCQMIKPFVDGFERARLSSLDSIDNHALLYFKTNLTTALQAGADDRASLRNRIKLMQLTRSNNGIAVVDKEEEDFAQITTNLAELANIVTLNMELIAMIVRRPISRIFGTPPKGFNATGENERFLHAERVQAMQKNILHKNLAQCLRLFQLHAGWEPMSGYKIKWNSTFKLSDMEKSTLGSQKTTSITGLFDSRLLNRREARTQLQADPHMGLGFIDPDEEDADDEEEDISAIQEAEQEAEAAKGHSAAVQSS
jgi:Uncharacterized protein conserved in bacteria